MSNIIPFKVHTTTETVGKWIVHCCIQSGSERFTMKELHDCYCSYCASIGIHPIGNTAFGRILTKLNFLSCKIGVVRARYGIGLKEGAMPPPAAPPPQPVWFGSSAELLRKLTEHNFSLDWLTANN